MKKFLRQALDWLAARVRALRRQRLQESDAAALPATVSLETPETKPVELPGKTDIAAKQSEVSQEPSPVDVPKVGSDSAAPESLLTQPVLPDSGDLTSQQSYDARSQPLSDYLRDQLARLA